MANILNQMLRYVGVNSYLTWIGTRRKPYTYKNVPTPVADNHMITTVVTKAKDTIFLDATSKYLNFGYPSIGIQSKEAMIGLSEENCVIKKVPTVASDKNTVHSENILSIVDNVLEGSHEVLLTGFEKLLMLYALESEDYKDADFLFRTLRLGKDKSEFSNVAFFNKERQDDTLKITFNSKTNGLVKKVNQKIYIKPQLDNYHLKDLVKNEAKNFDKKIDFLSKKTINTKLKIPVNYKVDFLPENQSFSNENFQVSIEYNQTESQVVVTKVITIKTLKISTEVIEEWNKFVKSLIRIKSKSIVLVPLNSQP